MACGCKKGPISVATARSATFNYCVDDNGSEECFAVLREARQYSKKKGLAKPRRVKL